MSKTSTISTNDLISAITKRCGDIPKKAVKQVVGEFLAAIENDVSAGKRLRLDKLGILQVKDRAARIGRNPQTGKEIHIPASKKVAFRPAKSLKDLVGKKITD